MDDPDRDMEMATVDVMVPVYNEEAVLARSISTLRDFLREHLPCSWQIVVVDNGSIDGTLAVAQSLSEQYEDVKYVPIEQKGRGRALRESWLASSADIVSYMDVDLSTRLDAFPELVRSLDEYDIAIGSRLMAGSRVGRSLKREITSRSYNMLIKLMFWPSFSDAQCGFKAAKREVVQDVVPMTRDNEWFFDTELLLLAERKGYRVGQIPVEWVEDADTRVRIVKTALQDIRGLLRLRFCPPRS
jgi:glycosyltransferase involved in cell wall biosynthesis